MRDLRALALECAARDEQVGRTLDEILELLSERGIRPTVADVTAFATDHGATNQLAADLAALVAQRLKGDASSRS
jgi:hypothetical protein